MQQDQNNTISVILNNQVFLLSTIDIYTIKASENKRNMQKPVCHLMTDLYFLFSIICHSNRQTRLSGCTEIFYSPLYYKTKNIYISQRYMSKAVWQQFLRLHITINILNMIKYEFCQDKNCQSYILAVTLAIQTKYQKSKLYINSLSSSFIRVLSLYC